MERPNDHHILFNRRAWESNPDTQILREKMGLIVRMDYFAHQALHRAVTTVPLLDHHAAGRVLSTMRRSRADGPMEVMDDFMLAVEGAQRNPKANSLDRALGHLVIQSVDAQREFINEGIVKAQVFDLGDRRHRDLRTA